MKGRRDRAGAKTRAFRSTPELKALYRAERKVKKSGLGRVIARRVLTEEGAADQKVSISIGAPRRTEADHWLCPYLIEGIVESGVQYVPGVDALQALLLALGGIRVALERTSRHFVWFGSGPGIPRQVPTGYGEAFEKRVESAIEREAKRDGLGRLKVRKA